MLQSLFPRIADDNFPKTDCLGTFPTIFCNALGILSYFTFLSLKYDI